MSLSLNIANFATRIATECKALHNADGDLTALNTTAKSNLVAAINELQAALAAEQQRSEIDDSRSTGNRTYSSSKIDAQIAAAVASLVNGAPGALDTLAEIASQLAADEAGAASMAAAIGNRVRFDDVQTLTAAQKAQALSNIAAAALVHTHAISEVTGLQAALDGKSAVGHKHPVSDVTGLQAALDGKSAVGHGHAIADTTGLQTALDGKSAVGHKHAISDTTGLQAALDGKAALAHTHTIADVANLQSTLDAKQPGSAALTGLAAVVTAADTLLYATAANTFDKTALTAFGRTLIAATNAAAARTALALGSAALSAATDFATAVHGHAIADVTGLQAAIDSKQASNALLTAISGVVSSANKLVYLTGSNTVSTADLTAFARTLLDDADAATMRTTLALGTAATMAASAFAAAVHTHAIADVTGLQAALDARALAADVGDTTTNFVTIFNNGLV